MSSASRLTAQTRPFAARRSTATEAETSAAEVGSASVKHDFAGLQIYPQTRQRIQASLAVNQPNDSLEREADRIADVVMRIPESQSQRGPASQLQRLQRETISDLVPTKPASAKGAVQPDAAPIVNEALRSSAQPLDAKTRAFMEPRFGHDFGQVRVHADVRAAESARAVDAHAYTVGQRIVFGAGQFQPNSVHGRRILAHELAHVVQQSAATHPAELQRWAISGNRATADREGDTLGALAQEVGAKFQDWKCIRPSPSMKRANAPNRPADFDEHYDRYISLGDKFEFANLTQTKGPAVAIHLFNATNPYAEVAELFYPGIGGITDAAAAIEASANAGRTPIREMVIFGHAHRGTMFGDATVFTPRDSNSEEPAPSFARAVEQRYPQRGWFTRNAKVRSVGCDSEAWGMDFARRFLREGATVTTTTATVIGSCSGKSPEYVAIAGDCRKLDGLSFQTPGGVPLEGPFWTASEFHGAGYWADVEGKL